MNDEDIDRALGVVMPDAETHEPHLDPSLLGAYVRHDPRAGGDIASIENHLSRCAACRQLALDLRKPLPPELVAFAESSLLRASRRRRVRRIVAGGVAASIAASVALVLAPFGGDELPRYELSGPRGAEKTVRGGETMSRPFVPSNEVELLLLPERAIHASKVDLAVYVKTPDGAIRHAPTSGIVERTHRGAFRYRAPARELFVDGDGVYELHVFVGKPRGRPANASTLEELVDELDDFQHLTARTEYRTRQEAP